MARLKNVSCLLFAAATLGFAGIFILTALFSLTEFPQQVNAMSTSSTVVITLNVQAGITISSPGNANLSTPISISQNSAVGTTTWTVSTNNILGYTLSVKASTTPAMQMASGTPIADYQTGAPNGWSVGANAAAFGFSGFGTDVPTATWGTGSSCSAATSTPSGTLLYKGFTTTTVTVANRASTTTPAGIPTTICYAAAQGTNFLIASGVYTATITATATSL